MTSTLQTPQLPLPPQAEGIKIFRSASAPSSVPPVFTQTALAASSLMTMLTSPPATSLLLATINTTTSERIIKVNMKRPSATVVMFVILCRRKRVPLQPL